MLVRAAEMLKTMAMNQRPLTAFSKLVSWFWKESARAPPTTLLKKVEIVATFCIFFDSCSCEDLIAGMAKHYQEINHAQFYVLGA